MCYAYAMHITYIHMKIYICVCVHVLCITATAHRVQTLLIRTRLPQAAASWQFHAIKKQAPPPAQPDTGASKVPQHLRKRRQAAGDIPSFLGNTETLYTTDRNRSKHVKKHFQTCSKQKIQDPLRSHEMRYRLLMASKRCATSWSVRKAEQ